MNSSGSLFGTDGIRGPFGSAPLDRATVVALGEALGRKLKLSIEKPRVVLGGDTRDSTPVLAGWLAAGLGRSGCRVQNAGTVPTPAIAFLTIELGADAGIAISASHNPYPDNGIKLIDSTGFKWSRSAEDLLEADLVTRTERRRPTDDVRESPEGTDIVKDIQLPVAPELASRFFERLLHTLPGDQPLAGLSIVLDTANGAAAGFAERLFKSLGAAAEMIGDRPNGQNINLDCGSTHPEAMAEATRRSKCDLGFAFDGDADRVILADQRGRIHDGDAILYLLARDLKEQRCLEPARIVATSMSNLGLEVALAKEGIEIERCDVGDRVVVETLRDQGLVLGGEQSGHIVHLERGTSGDGLMTAMAVSELVVRKGQPLSELLRPFERYPQVLVNVPVRSKPNLLEIPAVKTEARRVERELGDHGRLVLRYSGTEPLARVMIEGPKLDQVELLAQNLATAISQAIGTSAQTGATD